MAKNSQGATLGYVQESSLGTNGGSFSEIRYASELTLPTDTRIMIANPNLGHQHAADKSDVPVIVEKFRDGALKVMTRIRRSGSADTAPPIADFFESMGCTIATNGKTTIDSYTSTTAFDLVADEGAVGNAGLLELNSGVYYPVLAAEYATQDVTPGMAIPSASLATNDWEVMTTIWPRSQQVPSTKTLAFEHHSRATHTTGDDLSHEYQGCACSAVDDLVLKHGEAPEMGFNFTVGKIDQKSDAIAAESFACGAKFAVINDDFRFEYATASAAGGIARADLTPEEVTITFGITCVPILGEGDGVFAGMQGYILQFGIPKVKILATFDKDYWDEMEGSNTKKYIGIVQPTRALTTPAFGFWMPNSYLDPENPPVVDFTGKEYVRGTVTYIGTCAGYSSDTLNSEAGAAPWYFAISGAGA